MLLFVQAYYPPGLSMDLRRCVLPQSCVGVNLPLLCASSCERELTATLHREQ